jgi:hypothetical protein
MTRAVRVNHGNITRSTVRVPNTGTRQRHRSMASSVRGAGEGQRLQTPGGPAVVQVQEVAQGLRRATSAAEVVGRVPSVGLTGEGASAPPAIGASRAAPPPRAARAAREGPAVAAHPVVAGAAGVDVGEQEREETRETVMRAENGSLNTNDG